jgi:hypothetical protein
MTILSPFQSLSVTDSDDTRMARRPGEPAEATGDDGSGPPGPLGRAQRAALAAVALVAAGLFCYGAAGSYASVAALAAARQVPLPRLVPVGIDGGLIGTALLDIMLTWIGMPLPWLCQLTRVLMIATVAANGAAAGRIRSPPACTCSRPC